MRWVVGTGCLWGLLLGGCRAPLPADFEAPDAGSRIRAVVASARQPTFEDLQGMVRSLESDDPALRTLAIAALERTAGQRFGYDPWAPAGERRVAIDRWKRWLDDREAARPPSAEAARGDRQSFSGETPTR